MSLMFLVELPQSRKIKRLQLSQTVLTLFDPLQIMKIVILGSEMLRRLGLYLIHHRLNTVTSWIGAETFCWIIFRTLHVHHQSLFDIHLLPRKVVINENTSLLFRKKNVTKLDIRHKAEHSVLWFKLLTHC